MTNDGFSLRPDIFALIVKEILDEQIAYKLA
jgi:hypothetical protein